MPTVPMTRSMHSFPFTAFVRKQGEPVERMLRLAGLPGNCLDDPQMLVPVGGTLRFRELCARTCGLPNIALVATEHLKVADLGKSGEALLRAPTLYRALCEVRELVGTQSSDLVIDLHPLPGGHLWFCCRALSKFGPSEWHRGLYTLSVMLNVVRLADPAWSPAEIWIDGKAAPHKVEAIESLGSVAHFEKPNTGFLVPASMLALPIARSPVVKSPIAKSSVEQKGPDANGDQLWSTSPAKTYAEAVKQVIRSYASECWLGIKQASEVASTSVRTMQRRLSAEQTAYSSVLEQIRAEMAGELLENTDATVGEIAHELGYRHHGDFTRAFCRWAGVSPSEFRRQRRRT